MRGGRFQRYELRTTDLEGARAFYAKVLGSHFWGSDVALISLPERAAARGAPPHWLGHIVVPGATATHEQAAHPAVAGIEAAANQLVARGAQALGPVQRGNDGELAVLRDPFGAVLALRHEAANVESTVGVAGTAGVEGTAARGTSVAWHQLHTREREQALAWYGSLFGWSAGQLLELELGREPDLALGRELGGIQTFAWDELGPTVGGISNGARHPHIHPQWLFCFRVTDLETSAAQARLNGGRIMDPVQTAHGDLIAGGEDPQGAAFGLYQSAPTPPVQTPER